MCTSRLFSAHKLGWNGQRGVKFKPVGGSKSPYEGVVFVPSTPGSKLRKEVQKIKGIKFVERGGTTMRNLLVKSNPFTPTHCGREMCLPCNSPMSIPSDKPTTPGGTDDNMEIIGEEALGTASVSNHGS